MMSHYAEDMRAFQKETTISKILPHLPRRSDLPQGYSHIEVKLDFDIATATLEEIDMFRRQFASEFRLSQMVHLAAIKKSSLLVTLLTPSGAVSHIKQQIIDKGVSLEHILELTIDGECLYQCDTSDTQSKVHSGASSAEPSKSKTSTGLAIVIWTTRSQPKVSTDELKKHTSAMAVTFRKLGYIVVEEEAKDKDQFAAIISRERETIKSPDCPVVVVVSGEQYHQEINNLHCGHDKINISKDIVEPLLPPYAAHLAKNPKIFFINTVRDHSISFYEALQAPCDDNFVVALSSSTADTRHPLEYFQKELASKNDSLSEILEWIQDELPEKAVRVASHFKKPVFLHPVGPTERSTADSSSNKLSRRRRADKINSAIKFTPNSQGLAIVMEFVKKSGSSTTVAQTLGHHFNFAVVEESGIHTERKVKDIIYAAGHFVEYPSPDYPIVIAIFSRASWGNIRSMPCGSDKLSVSNLFTPLLPPSAPHLADNPKIFLINTCLPYSTHIRSDLSLPSTGNFLFAFTSTPLSTNYISRSLSTNLLISRGRESIDKVLQRVKESNERFTMTVVSHLSNKPVYFKPVETAKIKTVGRLALFVNVSKSDSITHHTREPQRLVEARTFKKLGFSVVEKDATELTDLANIYRRQLTGSPSPDCPVVVVLTLNGWSWSSLHSFELTQHILDPLLPLQAPHLTHSPKIVIIQGDLHESIYMMRYESRYMPAKGNYLVCLINHHYVYHDIDLNKELLTSCESIQDTLMWYEDESRQPETIKVISTLNQPVYLHPHGPPKSRTGQDPAVKATELTVARQRRADKINSAIKSSPKSRGLALVLGVNRWGTDSTEIAKMFAETLNFAVVEEYNIHTTRTLTDIIYAAGHLVEYPKTQDCPIAVFVMWDRAEGTIEALDCGDGNINISEDIIKPLLPPSAPHLADNPKIFISNTGTWKLKGTPTFKLPDSGNFVLCYTQFKDVHVVKQASEAFSKAFTQSSDSVDKVLERMKDDNPSLKMQVISHLNRPVHLFPGSSDPAGTTHSKPDDATKQKFLPKDTKPVVIPLKSGSHKGIDVTERLSIDVTSSEGTFNFEDCGLKISIPEDALPTGIDSCHLDITISLSGQYKFPEGHQLVSAVPWIRCTPPCRFKKPIRVDIQHCARKEAVKNLRFVKASCTQETRPYLFKTLDGRGSFSDSSSYGVIELNGFSGLAITCARESSVDPPIRKHAISLYYLRPNLSDWMVHLVVTWDLTTHIKGVKSFYDGEGAAKGAFLSGVEIDDEKLTVDIPMGGLYVGEWTLTPLIVPSLLREQVDYYKPGQEIPCIQMTAEPHSSSSSPLRCRLTLEGVKGPNVITIDIKPSSSAPATTRHRAPPAATVTLTVDTHLQTVKELIWGARVQWSSLAGALDVPHHTVQEIRYDLHCRRDGDRLERVLTEWMNGGTATIQHLLTALDSPTVNCRHISRQIRIQISTGTLTL